MEEKPPKINWHYAEDITVENGEEVSPIVIETDKKGELVQRIAFNTSIGKITYKPKRKVTQYSELSGFTLEKNDTELIKTSELILEYPMLSLLNKNAKKEPQKVVISYCELETEKGEKYYYFTDSQFKTIYYESFHKSNKSNIEKQKETKAKYSELPEE